MSDTTSWAQRIAESVKKSLENHRCSPIATYRLQFDKEMMTFRNAAGIVPYLSELGISHIYASPYLKARRGSRHGYAIVDYTKLNPELGADDDYRSLVDALHNNRMGQILDIVPNHMSATPAENLWWNDVLENGSSSPYATYFDIDWRPVKEELRNKILLPFLGEQYGQALESGEINLQYRDGAFFIRYHESLLPIEPRTYLAILMHDIDAFKKSQPEDSEAVRELESIITALEHLPEYTETGEDEIAERQREKEVIKDRLHTLTERTPAIGEFIGRNIKEFNGIPADPHSYDALDKLLDQQVYRLSHWKAAADEINYRRFFDINELASVCMEEPRVFSEGHCLIFELLVRGDVDALRVDHIDGLYDPQGYLQHLQLGYLLALGKAHYRQATATETPAKANSISGAVQPADPPAWNDIEPVFLKLIVASTRVSHEFLPLYVLVEKILSDSDSLPLEWLSAGTTGYDFLKSLSGLFVDPLGLEELYNIYSRFIGQRLDFLEIAHQSKLLILRVAMSSDLQLLTYKLNRISERYRRSRDFTMNTLQNALREIIAGFPIYRTYIRENHISERDRMVVIHAAARAKRRNPAANAAVFDFVRDVLLLERPPDIDEKTSHERNLFVGRVQQVTSSVMAKGIEDTAFYRYFPMSSLNEVGSDPIEGATSIKEFHRHNLYRRTKWPQSLVCTTTHDTKRSEDTRARIEVLSEIPILWRNAINRWARQNKQHRREVDGRAAPCRNDEYLFYQSLVGVWPLSPPQGKDLQQLTQRMVAYMQKATREAKLHTSWINPDMEYDEAMQGFVTRVLQDSPKNRFLASFIGFHEQIVNCGLYNALSQVLLKLTVPGVPDIYQGQELWDFSLVDPDNRRWVDYVQRRKMLARLQKSVGRKDRSLLVLSRRLARNPRDPSLKMFVTWRVLQFRRRHADLFRHGEYIPLDVDGVKADHICAFARRLPSASKTERKMVVVLAPRLLAKLTLPLANIGSIPPPVGHDVWADTRIIAENLESAQLQNLFTGQTYSLENSIIPVADCLLDFPVALLTNL